MKKFIVIQNKYCISLDNLLSFYIASGHDCPYVIRINFDVKDKVNQISCKSKEEAETIFNQIVDALNK